MTPDRADVRELAEKLRAECEQESINAREGRLAAFALAVLDECEKYLTPHDVFNKFEVGGCEAAESAIRAAARAFWGGEGK